MQLNVHIPGSLRKYEDKGTDVTVNSEPDITALGFAAARAVRAWVKSIPLVPSTSDLHFHISAAMESGNSVAAESDVDEKSGAPKRKKKAKK